MGSLLLIWRCCRRGIRPYPYPYPYPFAKSRIAADHTSKDVHPMPYDDMYYIYVPPGTVPVTAVSSH